VQAAEGELDFASLELVVDTASVDTGLDRRDVYLKSSDFLNVAAHPSLAFAARRVEEKSDDQVRILGAMTIRGATRDAVFDVEDCVRTRDRWGRDNTSFVMKSGIDRRDFGLTWSGALDSRATLLSDHVAIEIEVTAAKMAQAKRQGMTAAPTGAP
jgi:polyisoprenoid-binding protein YceI